MFNTLNNYTPKVSIGMPVYNGERFIKEALNSLLTQTFTNFELIISDNASTDGTEEICKEYAKNDPRIRYIRQTYNRGAIINFQFVLNEAVGEYFMWAAADDIWSNIFITFCIDNIGNNGSIMTAYKQKHRKSGEVISQTVPELSGKKKSPDDMIKYLKKPSGVMFYGMHKRSNLSFFLKQKHFDWMDCNFCIRIIHDYGFKTFNNVNLFTSGITEDTYLTKPKNGKFCNPLYYYFTSFKYIFCSLRTASITLFLLTRTLLIFFYRFTLPEIISRR